MRSDRAFVVGMMGGAVAWAFGHVTHRAGAAIGAAFGLVHAVIAGGMMGMMPALHPLIPEKVDAPGACLSNIPMGVIATFVLHAIYSAVLGAPYAPALRGAADHP